MTQSTSMPTFTLTVNTTGCLLARRKPFLPPWQHGRKCLSGRIADVINCNKKSIIQSVCHKNLKCFELRCDNYKSLLQSTAGFGLLRGFFAFSYTTFAWSLGGTWSWDVLGICSKFSGNPFSKQQENVCFFPLEYTCAGATIEVARK